MICRGERAKITRRSWRANEPDVSSAFLHGCCGFFLDEHPRRTLRWLAESFIGLQRPRYSIAVGLSVLTQHNFQLYSTILRGWFPSAGKAFVHWTILKAEKNKVKNEFIRFASEFQKYKGPLTIGVTEKKVKRVERARE
ncbi:hypothetical protein ALC53_08862 [Atta colombica]|uniref:Uncharacterized protein n=1 Tax=Atta colombica TaxID=520822 RepID=A0A195B838_9HYME|nr:hypothetical protein ALC53_08862 [Atta colombica]